MDLPIHTDEETLVILGVDTHASPTWAEIVRPKTRLAPNTRLSRASARVSRWQPSPSHRASHERRVAGVLEILPCSPSSSPSLSEGSPTFWSPQVTSRPPPNDRSQPSPQSSRK